MAENTVRSQKLAQAFDFTLTDLQTNRTGLLTPTQQKRLAEIRQIRGCGQRAASLGLGGSLLIFAVIALWVAPRNLSGFRAGLPYLILGAVIFTGLFLGAMILGQVRGRDLKTGRISLAEGEASEFSTKNVKSKSGRVMGTAYTLKIGQTRFRLADPAQFEAFEPGIRYRVFYVKDPPLHLILSAEIIDN